VLDSGSEDDTVEICKQYTDSVFVTDWPGFGIQKQRALDKARGDWVLSIDADEVVSAELRLEIEKALQQEQVNGYAIPAFPVIAASKSITAVGILIMC